MDIRLVFIIYLLHVVHSQEHNIFYPDDSKVLQAAQSQSTSIRSDDLSVIPIPIKNLSEIRGTELYEKQVDSIISKGLLKLTVAIDHAIIVTSGKESVNNIVYAPVGIAGALALVLLGSNGKTFQEISNILGLAAGMNIQNNTEIVHQQFGRLIGKLEQTSGFQFGSEVIFSNAIFLQSNYPIRNLYRKSAEQLYESEILNLDFEKNSTYAQKAINAWVAERTKGKIQELLSEPPSVSTKVIIASAMYFKAAWEFPFFEGSTKRRPFYINGKKSKSEIEVEMMANGGDFPYFKDRNLNCEIVGFPYKGKKTTMYVIVPTDSNKDLLKEFEAKLTPQDLEHLVSNTRLTPAVVLFPKMKIESTIDLKIALQHLGLNSLFNPHEANLALLSPGKRNYEQKNVPDLIKKSEKNPLSPVAPKFNTNLDNDDPPLIFSRNGEIVNCSEIFNPNNKINTCHDVVNQTRVTYKRFGDKVGRKVKRRRRRAANNIETLDTIREVLNRNPGLNLENPGLYADKVIHKVYMDITETGTEAAAVTSVSLTRDGSRITFRVDVPFFFFIRHEETKTVLFWGSVYTPTPNFRANAD